MIQKWFGSKVSCNVDMDDGMTNNFEVFVKGKAKTYLVHSRMTKNHKLFHEESQEHLAIVKKAIQEIIYGKEPTLPEARQKGEQAPILETKRSMETIKEEAKTEKTRLEAEMAEKARLGVVEEERKKAEQSAREKAEEAKKKKTQEAAKKRKKVAEQKSKAKALARKASTGSKLSMDSNRAQLDTARTNASAESSELAEASQKTEGPEADVQTDEAARLREDVQVQATSEAKQAEGECEETQPADTLLQAEVEANANAVKQTAAQAQNGSSFFGFICCRSSSLDDSGSEAPTIQLAVDDTALHM